MVTVTVSMAALRREFARSGLVPAVNSPSANGSFGPSCDLSNAQANLLKQPGPLSPFVGVSGARVARSRQGICDMANKPQTTLKTSQRVDPETMTSPILGPQSA